MTLDVARQVLETEADAIRRGIDSLGDDFERAGDVVVACRGAGGTLRTARRPGRLKMRATPMPSTGASRGPRRAGWAGEGVIGPPAQACAPVRRSLARRWRR